MPLIPSFKVKSRQRLLFYISIMILLGNTEVFETSSAELKSGNKMRQYLIIFLFDYKIYKASIS